ncbi:MAG: GldG family protein [Treponema sp.]|nr:GldG family protein [Treponema sp.]
MRRTFRYGMMSTIITALAILAVVMLNAGLSLVFRKYPLNIDLTEDRIFEISGETRDFLDRLDKDVEIYVLNTEDRFTASSPANYFVQANEVIRKYAQLSSRIRLIYLDLLRNPDFGSRYPGLSLAVNDILLVSGERTRVLRSTDLFNIQNSAYGQYITSSRAEQTMTSAVLNITGEKQVFVAVIGGHGEADIRAFTELLSLNAYEVSSVNLLTEDIPTEISLAVLAVPDRDLTGEELRKLDAFLESGSNKNLFYFASPSQPALPNLASFLGEWGIAVDEGVAFETNPARILGDSVYISLVDYAEDRFSKNTAERGLYPVIPQSRPLRPVYEAERYRSVSTLLRMSAGSGIRPAGTGPEWVPAPEDIRGNVPVLLLSRSLRNGLLGELERANVLVCGSVFAIESSILGSPNIANSAYFLELAGSLTGREISVRIEDKTIGFSELRITRENLILIAVIFVALLPLGVLITGVVVWLRRRYK